MNSNSSSNLSNNNKKQFEIRRNLLISNIQSKYSIPRPKSKSSTSTLQTPTGLNSKLKKSVEIKNNNSIESKPKEKLTLLNHKTTTLKQLESNLNITNLEDSGVWSNNSSIQHQQQSKHYLNLLNNHDTLFNKNFKYLVYNKNFLKFKALININPEMLNQKYVKQNDLKSYSKAPSSNSNINSYRQTSTDNLKPRFIKFVRLLINVLKIVNIHKASRQRIDNNSKLISNLIDSESFNAEIFKKELFSKPKEPAFPEEAKKMLQLEPNERTEEMIRYIIISLNFSVPEFLEYPIYMQKMIAKYSYYHEFDPGRVILRQGHYPDNYYIVISGHALEIRTNSSFGPTPIGRFQRGDTFGDKAIINNTLRPTSVTVNGSKPICLLCIDKDDFYRIQTPVENESEKLDFLKTKCTLLNYVNYPFDNLAKDNRRNQAYCSIYYKSGTIICENSQTDDWLYVIKSGSCKVLKKIKFNQNALDIYLAETKRSSYMNKLNELYNLNHSNIKTNNKQSNYYMKNDYQKMVPFTEQIHKSLKLTNKLKNDDVYLEMNKLKVGDVFGLHDIILTEQDDCKEPLILSSDGIECILLNRRYFLKHLPSQAMLMLRFNLNPYPTDDYFIKKYFHSFTWKDFTINCKNELVEKIKEKKRPKTSVHY